MPKPSYNPTRVLRDTVKDQGYDPGPEGETNSNDERTYSLPISRPPGPLEAGDDFGHRPIGEIGTPPKPKRSETNPLFKDIDTKLPDVGPVGLDWLGEAPSRYVSQAGDWHHPTEPNEPPARDEPAAPKRAPKGGRA